MNGTGTLDLLLRGDQLQREQLYAYLVCPLRPNPTYVARLGD